MLSSYKLRHIEKNARFGIFGGKIEVENFNKTKHILVGEQWVKGYMPTLDESTEPPRELFIPPIINKNKALEDKLDRQYEQDKATQQEIKMLREEVKKAKETNLIGKCITKEPNLSRPTVFQPPNPAKNEATQFAIECVYSFESEKNYLPIKKELWNLIRLHALNESSTHVESTGKDSVKIWYTPWTKDLCGRFCKNYLKDYRKDTER